MTSSEKHYQWEWMLQSSPEAIWPFFADTNRLNQDTGLFPVEESNRAQASSRNARRDLKYILPVPIHVTFTERPFEWVYPYRYGVERFFHGSPIETFRILAQFERRPEGGTRLQYDVWIRPRNILGRIASDVVIGSIAKARFSKAIAVYDEQATQQVIPFIPRSIRLVPGAEARLAQMETQLVGQGSDPDLVARLLFLIRNADDLTVSRLRPYYYADLWGYGRSDVLNLFLFATRSGLLDFQWEVLCPLCRGAEDRVSNRLADVSSSGHCHSCNIDFETNFENSIELTFAPNAAIRQVERYDFCVAGPEITDHIIVQQLLAADAVRSVAPMLEPGRYRLRTMNLPGSQHFRVTENNVGLARLEVNVDAQGWSPDELALTPSPELIIKNETDEEQLFILERTAWSDQAVTAAEVISLQKFRDLFANEALRPGEQIGVGSLTILFTDLVDSTRMYREIGDAPAFGLVMNHFDVLHDAIEAEGGAIVKTIGDAVMAAFRRPISALRVMARAQEILARPPKGQRPLFLKAAIHSGPSIAVTLNERLDYFGTSINIAARLEKFATGGDVIVSDYVYMDPEVQEYIASQDNDYHAIYFEEMLKGFDDECFKLWRVTQKAR